MNTKLALLTGGSRGLPDDIGGMIALLLSTENSWVNGQRIEVSGGILLQDVKSMGLPTLYNMAGVNDQAERMPTWQYVIEVPEVCAWHYSSILCAFVEPDDRQRAYHPRSNVHERSLDISVSVEGR